HAAPIARAGAVEAPAVRAHAHAPIRASRATAVSPQLADFTPQRGDLPVQFGNLALHVHRTIGPTVAGHPALGTAVGPAIIVTHRPAIIVTWPMFRAALARLRPAPPIVIVVMLVIVGARRQCADRGEQT